MEESSSQKAATVTSVPPVVAENIDRLVKRQLAREERRGFFHKTADHITRTIGSPPVLFFHFLFFSSWILLNTSTAVRFDPFPFEFLTLFASLEAIILSIMVLMVQNEIQIEADRRAELDLHINLLTEKESTLILKKLVRIEARLGIAIDAQERQYVSELIKEIDPTDIAQSLEDAT